MKKIAKLFLASVILFSSFALFSCRDMIHDIREISGSETKRRSLEMVSVSNSFEINAYETSFVLWHDVREWANDNGYKFILPGKAGDKEVSEPGLYGYLPVTSAHPADIIVWLNALSEKNGLEPVYYEDSGYTKVLRSAWLISNYQEIDEYDGKLTDINGNPITSYDYSIKSNFSTKDDAKGYRLPSKGDWLNAAKSGGKDKKAYGVSDDYRDVAALKYIHAFAQFTPNSLGIYDTIGNVSELMLDGTTYSAYCFHYNMGSSSGTLFSPNNVAHIYGNWPELFGFRIARKI